MSLAQERMRVKFRPVFREIKALKSKIHLKEGWIFVEHKYTIEELLNSTHYQKIDSYTKKIGDDIERWYSEGKLSEEEEIAYLECREEVEDRLDELNMEIESREPTWWEQIKDTMKEFVILIMNNLPDKFGKKLLSYFKSGKKLLESLFGNIPKLTR